MIYTFLMEKAKELPFWIFYNPNQIGHDFYIEEFGYGVCTPKWIFAETRKNNLLQIVFDGIAHVSVGQSKPFVVREGEAFYLPANVPHWYEADEKFPTTRAWISWSGECTSFFENKFNRGANPYLLKVRDLDAVKKTFRSLQEKRDHTDPSLLQIYSGFYEILSYCVHDTAALNNTDSQERLLVNDVMKYIDDNLSDQLTIQSIAFSFGYHPSSLFRKFKKLTGMSVKGYILHRRLALAKALICESTLSVDEIVTRCGYLNQAALNSLFLRHSYASLTKYVKEHRPAK